MDVDRAFVTVPIGPPDTIEQLLAREGKSDVRREESQQIELACGQRYHLATATRLPAPDIDLQVPDTHDILRHRAFSRATQDGVHTGDQLPGREGLDQIVVRSKLKSEDSVHLVVSGRQEQDGDVAFGPNPAAYVETIELARKPDIEHDNPRILLVHDEKAPFSIRGQEHPKPIATQVQIHEISNVWIVLNHHHGSGFSRSHGP